MQGLRSGHCVLINNQNLSHLGRTSVFGVGVGWLVCFWLLVESGSKFPLLGWQTEALEALRLEREKLEEETSSREKDRATPAILGPLLERKGARRLPVTEQGQRAPGAVMAAGAKWPRPAPKLSSSLVKPVTTTAQSGPASAATWAMREGPGPHAWGH